MKEFKNAILPHMQCLHSERKNCYLIISYCREDYFTHKDDQTKSQNKKKTKNRRKKTAWKDINTYFIRANYLNGIFYDEPVFVLIERRVLFKMQSDANLLRIIKMFNMDKKKWISSSQTENHVKSKNVWQSESNDTQRIEKEVLYVENST